MKIVRFKADQRIRYGILEEGSIRVITGEPFRGIRLTDICLRLNEVRLLSPCTPSKIVAVGLNYRSHAQEFHLPIPETPLIFLKPSTAVIGPEDNIVYPAVSHRVDYEAELGVVIGKKTHRVSADKVLDYILGYTCVNDVTARDLQKKDGQWTRAKGFDTFAPVGPCIETVLDPANITLETYVNGELKQQGNTGDLIYPVPALVSFISSVMTLLPGDIIATGTPGGIGPILPGDTVEIKIRPIGILRNFVIKEG